jgi:HPt (histidine-containing phosphotransfer) domain-containing protein
MHVHPPHRRRHPGAEPGAGGIGPALDADAIERLRQLDPDGSRGFVVQVLRTYEASLLRHLASIEASAAAGAVADVGRVAHTLKSSSASVGASRLATVCADVERRARAGDPDVLGAPLVALREEGARALSAVRAMLPQ